MVFTKYVNQARQCLWQYNYPCLSPSYTAAVQVVQSLVSKTDKDALFAAIDDLSYGAGSINPAAAIRKMTEMFAEGRSSARKVGYLLVASFSSFPMSEMLAAATAAQEAGIELYIIGENHVVTSSSSSLQTHDCSVLFVQLAIGVSECITICVAVWENHAEVAGR